MRTRVLAVLVTGGALLAGCQRWARPEADPGLEGPPALTRATLQHPLDVVGPRVDPRTRTGGAAVAGTVPHLAEGRDAVCLPFRPPERQLAAGLLPLPEDEERAVGGAGLEPEAPPECP